MCIRRLLAVMALAATLGCSAPPEKERHQAEGAIAAAREVGAATYAAADLTAAEEALRRYAAAVEQRDYRQALSLAVDARDTAYRAAKRSGDAKAAARSQAERLMADVERLLNATAASGGTGPSRPPGARTAAADTVSDAQQHLQEARALIAQQAYRSAVEVLGPIAAELQADAATGREALPRKPR